MWLLYSWFKQEVCYGIHAYEQGCELDRFLIEFKFEFKDFCLSSSSSSSAKMAEFGEFELAALFKISLKQTYPN